MSYGDVQFEISFLTESTFVCLQNLVVKTQEQHVSLDISYSKIHEMLQN
jgi:hypothetical protein